jgi:hypothetical protein
MANLKLIKVTGSPFCSIFYGCIGIEERENQFQIIKDGRLHGQSSYSDTGWKYATAEEIEESWDAIYPHWKPEKGDKVIVTQDYPNWINCKGTIIEKDPGADDYYRVESEDGMMSTFNYTSQMILAPYVEATVEPKQHSLDGFKLGDRVESTESGATIGKKGSVVHFDQGYIGVCFDENIGGHNCNDHCPYGRGRYLRVTDVKHYIEPEKPKETTMTKFKEGDRVKCIGITARGYGKLGTVRRMGESIGVEFDENVDGHYLDGCCEKGYGWWIKSSDLELVTESKQETVSIRFLTKQEFVDKGLWAYTYPKGWNSDGHMNKYLGQSVVIPKSNIGSDGTFRYQDWTFKVTDYLVTEGASSSESTPSPVIDTKPEKPPRRFKVGDKVTYKSLAQCNGGYNYGGEDQTGFVGIVESEMSYELDKGCYGLRVTTKGGDYCYNMLESEFHEYDFGYVPITSGAIGTSEPATRLIIKGSSAAADGNHIFVNGVAYPISHYSSDGFTHSTIATIDSDPLSSYKQKPITIKPKPKTKLTTI